jgi:putative ABC transport system substrate-binding protein
MQIEQLRRREIIALLGSAAAWPLAARAQSPRVPVIGSLHSATAGGLWLPLDAAFRRGLSEAGYTEGRNLTIETRWADGLYDRSRRSTRAASSPRLEA